MGGERAKHQRPARLLGRLLFGLRARTSQSSLAAEAVEPQAPPFKVELKDLDHLRSSFTLSIGPSGCRLSRIESAIRSTAYFRIGNHERLLFYSDAVAPPVSAGARLAHTSTLYYRLCSRTANVQGPRISWEGDRNSAPGPGLLEGALLQAIKQGKTIKALREDIACALAVGDPNRIVLIARGGLREGPVEGNYWDISQVGSAWLARRLGVNVSKQRDYLVVRGIRREYVYHPSLSGGQHNSYEGRAAGSLRVHEIRDWLHSRIVGGQDRALGLQCEGIDFARRSIRLLRGSHGRGRDLRRADWVALGANAVEFRVPLEVAEAHSAQDAWLLGPSEECAVCGDEKTIADMPLRITERCEHARPGTCKDCLRRWIESSLADTAWDRLRCPECPQLLTHADVRRWASSPVFARYDGLALRAALGEMRHFRWCLAGCGSGQIHVSRPRSPPSSCKPEVFRCHVCHARQCTVHDVPWHRGETCADFDLRARRRLRDDLRTREAVSKMAKACPGCLRDVHKHSGCNHITCLCGHEWCYMCFAPYVRDGAGFLRCRHEPRCSERDPLAEIPPPARTPPPEDAPAEPEQPRAPTPPPPAPEDLEQDQVLDA
ncbi:hypothetical protein RB597_009331 [Gaeumannomyces tritici]